MENLNIGKKKTVLLLRWLIIIITSCLILFSRSHVSFLSPPNLIIYVLLSSNIILSFLPHSFFSKWWFGYFFVLFDTTLLSTGIYMTGKPSAEFYLLFFLVIIATTFGSDLRSIIRNTLIVSAVYVIILYNHSQLDGVVYDESLMLRAPFLFIMSLFYGYLVEQTKRQSLKAEDLEAKKREVEILLEVTKSVSSSLDIHQVLLTIVNKVAEYIPADRCSIILVDSQHTHGYVVASHDVPEIDRLKIDLEKYPEIFKSLKSKEVVIIDDIDDDPLMTEIRETLKQIPIKSLMVVPIAYQEEVIGTLLLRVMRQAHQFSQEETKFCEIVANTSANAIKNAQLYEQIKMQAKTDSLTALLNHRSFLESFQDEVMRTRRTKKPFSVIMIDVDNFKSINDSQGHQHGDKVLYELARSLKANTRSVDIVARYGGDEFICLLPEAFHEQGLLAGSRIIEKTRERLKSKGLNISISMGLATYLYHTEDPTMLLQLADQAMYLAKYQGGDQIFTFEQSETRDMNAWNQKVFEAFLAIKTLSRFDNSQKIAADLTEQLNKMLSVDSSPQSLYEIVTSLSSALDARDHYTNGHSERAIEYAKQIAQVLKLSAQQQEELIYLCLLHDIGKIGIPDHILNKPGKLTSEEYEIMKRHAEIGEKIISPIDSLRSLKPLIRHHQEWYDGSGYPDGICAGAIPMACRILSVVDTFDAMTSDRPYRKALPIEAAVEELMRCAGTQFDPEVVETLLKILDEEATSLRSGSLSSGNQSYYR